MAADAKTTQRKKLVETPAFGTKTKGFFKDASAGSREGSRDKKGGHVSGFSTPGVQSRSKNKLMKGAIIIEKATSSSKILPHQ